MIMIHFLLILIFSICCYFAGGALFNCILHIIYLSSLDRLPERLNPKWMKTHIGNAIASIISLFLSFILLVLSNYKFGININTLMLFFGICTGLLVIAIRYDKREKNTKQ
jgi:hypothetical protein